ncbi:MAG: ribonuclease P protein component [Pseudobdellovibrionaceae bacterium]
MNSHYWWQVIIPKTTSLRTIQDFEILKENGRRRKILPWVLVSFMFNKLGYHRLGVTASKKIGSAVMRNRLKRWCRNYLRQNHPKSDRTYDFNVIFLPQNTKTNREFYQTRKYSEFKQSMDELFKVL